MTIAAVHASKDVDKIRNSVREAAAFTRWSLSQLSPDPMFALYQLHFEQHGHNPLKYRPQSLKEQTYRTFKVMTILAAADHILREFPVDGGLYLKLAEDFPKNLGPFSMAPRAPEKPEIQSIQEGKLEAWVFAATTSPTRITSNNVLRKKFQRLTSAPADIRLVYFYWPRVRPEPQRNANSRFNPNGDLYHQYEQWYLDDMKRRREQELREELECRDDLAHDFYHERLRELRVSSREPRTHSQERAAGRDIQIWSLPLKVLL